MRRPRVKPEHAPFQTVDGNVRIGGGVYGIAAEIEDPEGWVWLLVQACDGERDRDQVIARVLRGHSEVSPREVCEALDALTEAGHVEDAAAGRPDGFSDRECERYERNAQYFRWTDLRPHGSIWEVQRRLKQSRVLVVGVGGAGGAAALALAAAGIGDLHCVDFDVVELSNLNRQVLYTEADVGRPKVDAAVDRLRQVNSDITVTGQHARIEQPEDFLPLLEGRDLMVLSADRPDDLRRWANRACLKVGTPWVDGGYRGPQITSSGYVPGQSACWECLRIADERHRSLHSASYGDMLKAQPKVPGGHPVISVTAGISGHLQAHWAIALLTGMSVVEAGSLWGVNLMAPGEPLMVRYPPQRDCPACGGR